MGSTQTKKTKPDPSALAPYFARAEQVDALMRGIFPNDIAEMILSYEGDTASNALNGLEVMRMLRRFTQCSSIYDAHIAESLMTRGAQSRAGSTILMRVGDRINARHAYVNPHVWYRGKDELEAHFRRYQAMIEVRDAERLAAGARVRATAPRTEWRAPGLRPHRV